MKVKKLVFVYLFRVVIYINRYSPLPNRRSLSSEPPDSQQQKAHIHFGNKIKKLLSDLQNFQEIYFINFANLAKKV